MRHWCLLLMPQSHQLLKGKKSHLVTWRAGWNLNYKVVKFKPKSMSLLKASWPFSLRPFDFPLTGPLGAKGLGLCKVHGGWGQLIICMVQLGAIFQFSLTRIQGSFCSCKEANSPEVQFVHQCNLLLSHPLHTTPPPLLSCPSLFSYL